MDITAKTWRSNPEIISAQPAVYDRRPFGTIAAIFDGMVVHIGLSRCSPVDKFDPVIGEARAVARARLQMAVDRHLIPKRRLDKMRRRAGYQRDKGYLPYLMTLPVDGPEQVKFEEMFGIKLKPTPAPELKVVVPVKTVKAPTKTRAKSAPKKKAKAGKRT